MAVTDPATTRRWWLIYTVNGTQHKLQMRTANVATASTVSGFYSSLLGALSSGLNAINVLGMETAIQGSNVRNPIAYSGGVSFGLGTEVDTDGRPRTWSFTGRSSDGKKTKLFIFGAKTIGEGDMRIDTTENAGVANAVTFLNGTLGAFLSITGLQPVWHGYANVGYNDHWIKEYRKG